jgi:RNA polymerase sigma-70 factor (ECF subfamily)
METKAEHLVDQELILSCQRGDQEAFERLVKRYYQNAFRMALSRVGNRETALDISQEAFIRIYRNIERFEVERSFSAWLYVIIKNLCRNYRERRQKRWWVFSDVFRENHRSPQTEELIEDKSSDSELEIMERRKLLWETIGELPETDREISEVLEIPPGTVMSRLYYARKKLAKLLTEKNEWL